MADVHLVPYGEAQKRFSETLSYIMSPIPPVTFENIQKLRWKSLSVRFEKVMQDHRQEAKENGTASGIVEIRAERAVVGRYSDGCTRRRRK